jgi:formate--tetrahydrofolate ligase
MSSDLRPIQEIAATAGIPEEFLEPYGRYAAKIRLDYLASVASRAPGKMILVTAMTPTSHGEGKTVISIGLTQALHRLGKRVLATIRQPSLGPVFGVKGGASGGGQSQLLPAELLNLHFTGDFHAITSAHNLLSAMLDAHIFHGNELRIDPAQITWPRALDMNDRALRAITVAQGGKSNGVPRESGFVITAASEIMAVLALASSRADLRRRLEQIVVGCSTGGNPVRARDLKAAGAMMALLNQAILPNLVQTTEHVPALVHAGPFGNIAHGTSSILAQKMALQTADFVVNEAGFAADLGAEKYFDIVMPASGIKPSVAVLVASVRAIAAHGDGGFANLARHIANLRGFGVPIVVAVNRFPDDTGPQLAEVEQFCAAQGVPSAVADVFARGGSGGIELAEKVASACETGSADPKPIYASECGVEQKVTAIATRIYGAAAVKVEPRAKEKIEKFTALGYGHLPVCMAKTQSSLTDNPKLLGAPTGWTLTVSDAHLCAAAGFIVLIAGNMLRMPGLGKDPQAFHIDADDQGNILGLR